MPAHMIDRAPPRNRSDPARECRWIPQGAEFFPCLQKDFLCQIRCAVRRHMSEQDRIYETTEARI